MTSKAEILTEMKRNDIENRDYNFKNCANCLIKLRKAGNKTPEAEKSALKAEKVLRKKRKN